MLELHDVHTYYGLNHVLRGISLKVAAGEIVALVGRNGVGKTVTFNSIIGFVCPRNGSILFQGRNIIGLPTYKIVQSGICLVPQGRRIFPSLTVKENLEVGARHVRDEGGWNIERVYELFPELKERARNRGNQLSGGEAQMLAIGRALMTNPKLLLMDEPSEGLAPIAIRRLIEVLQQLRGMEFPILLIEHNIRLVLALVDRVYVMSNGMIVHESTPDDLRANEEIKSKYLAV